MSGPIDPQDQAGLQPDPVRRLHVLIHGRVQGVNFRYATRSRAAELGLRGWVRNLSDGSVEAVFEGPEVDLQAILGWCQKGPPSARVQEVETHWETAEGSLSGFSVRG